MKKVNLSKNLNQKGQTLIIVSILMMIALAIGVSISTRTISSLRRTTNVDSSSRTLAAAEAGAEYTLSKTHAELNTMISGDTNDCSSVARFIYPDSSTATPITNSSQADVSSSSASIEVKRYGCIPEDQTFTFKVSQDDVLELKFEHAPSTITSNVKFDLSWEFENPESPTSIYLIEISGQDSNNLENIRKGYRDPGSETNNFETVASALQGFSYTTRPYPRIIRIVSLYGDSTVKIKNKTNNVTFPFQGFQITSTGVLGEQPVEGNIKDGTRRSVIVTRSLPYLPAIFNFALFSQSGSLNK